MPTNDLIVNRVLSASTTIPGRCINDVRMHRLIIDEPTHAGGPGEQMTPAEAFLAGISACGVLLVQGRARDSRVRLDRTEVTIEAVRDRRDTSVFQRINMLFRLSGPTQTEGFSLVEHYKSH